MFFVDVNLFIGSLNVRSLVECYTDACICSSRPVAKCHSGDW